LTRKAEIQNFLIEKGIDFEEAATAVELKAILRRYKDRFEVREVPK